jgi:Protein of unknown function (DUF565)
MQNTRLSNLLNFLAIKLQVWINNPWRRVSVQLICLLLGNFLGPAIALAAGQRQQIDILIAILILAATELVSMLVYRRQQVSDLGSFGLESLNALKIGFVYSLFVDALKLSS